MKKTMPGYNLHKGEGNREFIYHVDFAKNFPAAPQVFVALAQSDCGNEEDYRLSIFTRNVKNTGFDLVLNTWSDTTLYSATAAWIAFDSSFCGPARMHHNWHSIDPFQTQV